jgi:uncharacterized protein HemX
MARNRRSQSAAIRFGPAIKAFLLCLLIGGSGVGYVWQKSQIDELGRQIRKREQETSALQKQNEKLRRQLSLMYSPRFLEAKIQELNLGLVQAQPSQKWVLREKPAEPLAPTRELQYAAQ